MLAVKNEHELFELIDSCQNVPACRKGQSPYDMMADILMSYYEDTETFLKQLSVIFRMLDSLRKRGNST